MQVILCPNADTARETLSNLHALGMRTATVEAEYGTVVAEGSVLTLAHHTGEWRSEPAPCNNLTVPALDVEAIVVSHLDLDTVGGILRIVHGSKDVLFKGAMSAFWEAAQVADLNGPHWLPDLVSPEMLGLIRYVWSRAPRSPIVDRANPQPINVTELVLGAWTDIITSVYAALEDDETTTDLVAVGNAWAEERTAAVEKWFNAELSTAEVRVFDVTDPDERVFCNANYRHADGGVARAVVTRHPGAITISLESPIAGGDCAKLMQALFGPEAGGHAGIAGGPRNQAYSREDLERTVTAVKAAVAPVLV